MQDNLICSLCERVIQSPKASRLLQTLEDCCLIDLSDYPQETLIVLEQLPQMVSQTSSISTAWELSRNGLWLYPGKSGIQGVVSQFEYREVFHQRTLIFNSIVLEQFHPRGICTATYKLLNFLVVKAQKSILSFTQYCKTFLIYIIKVFEIFAFFNSTLSSKFTFILTTHLSLHQLNTKFCR